MLRSIKDPEIPLKYTTAVRSDALPHVHGVQSLRAFLKGNKTYQRLKLRDRRVKADLKDYLGKDLTKEGRIIGSGTGHMDEYFRTRNLLDVEEEEAKKNSDSDSDSDPKFSEGSSDEEFEDEEVKEGEEEEEGEGGADSVAGGSTMNDVAASMSLHSAGSVASAATNVTKTVSPKKLKARRAKAAEESKTLLDDAAKLKKEGGWLWTPFPGRMTGLVGTSKGRVCAVACAQDATLIATYPAYFRDSDDHDGVLRGVLEIALLQAEKAREEVGDSPFVTEWLPRTPIYKEYLRQLNRQRRRWMKRQQKKQFSWFGSSSLVSSMAESSFGDSRSRRKKRTSSYTDSYTSSWESDSYSSSGSYSSYTRSYSGSGSYSGSYSDSYSSDYSGSYSSRSSDSDSRSRSTSGYSKSTASHTPMSRHRRARGSQRGHTGPMTPPMTRPGPPETGAPPVHDTGTGYTPIRMKQKLLPARPKTPSEERLYAILRPRCRADPKVRWLLWNECHCIL